MSIRKSETPLFCLVLVGVWLLCPGSISRADGRGSDLTPPQESSTEAICVLVERVWAEQAHAHAVDEHSILRVGALFHEVVAQSDCHPVDAERLRDSLDTYLNQFANTFTGARRNEACYWMAWLLARCATRPVPSVREIEQTRAWFQGFTDEVIERLDRRARNGLGADYPVYRPKVEQALHACRESLQASFRRFHDDPLFPAFKTPLSETAQRKILEQVSRTGASGISWRSLVSPPAGEDEPFAQRLATFSQRAARRVTCWILWSSASAELEKPEYWGGMMARATSTSPEDGAWPVEMSARQKPKVKPPVAETSAR